MFVSERYDCFVEGHRLRNATVVSGGITWQKDKETIYRQILDTGDGMHDKRLRCWVLAATFVFLAFGFCSIHPASCPDEGDRLPSMVVPTGDDGPDRLPSIVVPDFGTGEGDRLPSMVVPTGDDGPDRLPSRTVILRF